MKKAQTSAEVLVILSIVLTIAVLYLVVSGQLHSFVGASNSETNVFFESYDIGISNVEIGNQTNTLTLQNNYPYTIVLKNVTGQIDLDEVNFYNGSLILEPLDRTTLTSDLDLSCDPNAEYDLFFTFTYSTSDVSSQRTLSPEIAYVFRCN